MIKKIAALGIIGTLAFVPALAFADDMAKPATTEMKPKTHKHKTTKHKSSAKAKPMASETPKS